MDFGSKIELLWNCSPQLFDGLLVTVELTLGSAVFAFLLAVALGLAAGAKNLVLRGSARVFIEFFRGTSLLVQLFWFFYVLPLFGFRLESIVCGILALSLNYGAYGAEVVRGAIASVPKPQIEAATALNFGYWQRMRRVVFPQAWAEMIPPLTNLLIQLLKGTALASYILLQDLTFQIEQLRRGSGDTIFAFGVGLVLYFVLGYLLTLLMNALEVRAKSRLGTGPTLREIFGLAPVFDQPVGARS
ncbi:MULTISPECIES: ectoine/hydroxyectoine ABC transporter permease subunit EhuC [Rhodococcus]|uniref:ectoine/hydroxyectoine ABC transporter permease subunit EhuC n=1 Tax=Rhodococcus TaxID=1827 RepID=UPI001E57863C|nr:ectoine/hydroxyectoine ABC transporter permease subunit EhuC [Rhodococcus pyridinivorans]MCD2115710.1 ectoine/hydroxyectoine ABC transporter permease subunit EhuC [Rhodococcus pyridinivorans]MCZ4624068.1 ectoine/hydroxyectoine ABC transporter permease subunit EhuC [Rhodococcus pyridinivorans]MCZ4645280.1 ectoine/hydroxyectoine ABC transporter permease subunit EhuC [Rhodococcus pyridinivorans]MDJ0483412.1 ectoine/hydroxyectoine ABC transporter permease subunit EhuC [Rhodococcus pyridinivorans